MITPKIKALFQFIEYLHSNIDNFNLNNDLIKELEQLGEKRQKVISKKTYKDKLKYDEVQAEIETKFKILQGNTANLIKAKAKELNVCNFDNELNYSFNGIEADILQLKENFSKDDLPEIFKHKQQYIEYRTKTHRTFLSLAFFIDKLDRVTKSLFDYFKETEQNEFEAFEIKAIPVNSIAEAIQGFKKGQTKFTLPTNFLFNTSTSKALPPQPITKALPPQPIVESPFSVLEWATIFYYADETKLLTENRIISERMKEFMSKHQINTTFDNFKAKYYEAKKRINEKNDYPINKLELIIPFLKENYKQTVTKVENDIIILEENKPEY